MENIEKLHKGSIRCQGNDAGAKVLALKRLVNGVYCENIDELGVSVEPLLNDKLEVVGEEWQLVVKWKNLNGVSNDNR